MKYLYFDAMSSTPVHPDVLSSMNNVYEKYLGNPSSAHNFGYELKRLVDAAAIKLKSFLSADNYDVVWTSGATEAINLAIYGAANSYKRQGNHIITFATEHKATLNICKHLESLGFEVSILPVKSDGLIDFDLLTEAICDRTVLVSICHVNNEIGVIQDLKKIVDISHNKGCLVHVDAAQSIGKVNLDLQEIPADFVSLSAHKFYGPQGIGALLVNNKPRRHLQQMIFGGSQQNFRSGTLPAALIVGMGVAAELNFANEKIEHWHKIIISNLNELGGVTINGCPKNRVPHNININICGVNSESLKYICSDIAFSSGSACNAKSPEPSHVLLALGLDYEFAAHSIRISLGSHLTDENVENFCIELKSSVRHLRFIAGS